MALEDFFEDFIFMDDVSVPDGLGGVIHELREGAPFRAGISTISTNEAKIAYQAGTKTIYTITTTLRVELEYRDLVKRLKDNRIYKATSDAVDNTTPDVAQMQYRDVTAEVIDLEKRQ